MKRNIFLLFNILLLFFSACSFNNEDKQQKPVEQNQPNENGEENSTRIEFSNKTDFLVKIYSDSLHQNKLAEIESNDKKVFQAEYLRTGTAFYLDYYLIVNGLRIKYGDGTSIVQLKENDCIKAEIPMLQNSYNNYIVIGLNNLSKSGIELMQSTRICFKDDGTSILNEKETCYFLFSGELNISELKINDNGNMFVFSDSLELEFEKSNIYSFEYAGDGKLALRSKVSFNPSINSRIWKIPLSQDTGKCLTADKFKPRNKSSDGYYFTGQISYNKDFRNKESIPYYAEISPDGTVKDKIQRFDDNIDYLKTDQYLEYDGSFIACGTKYSSDIGKKQLFIYGDGEADFYITPDLEKFSYINSLIHKVENVFSILIDTQTENSSGLYIYEFTMESFNKVTGKVVYSAEGIFPSDLLYYNGSYILLGTKDENDSSISVIDFINGASYDTEGHSEIEGYLLESLSLSNELSRAFATGSFYQERRGIDVATFAEIDLKNKCFINSQKKPLTFVSKDESKHSSFISSYIKNNELWLSGYSDEEIDNGELLGKCHPLLVIYDINKNKVRLELHYDDMEGYKIFSCFVSAIGTPLVEFYNMTTGMSYLASCGLLGELPEKTLPALPRNTAIENVKLPNITITVFDSDDDEYEIPMQYGTELDKAGFEEKYEKLEDFSTCSGKELVGWEYENDEGDYETLTFPYKFKEDIYLYPIFKISVPTGVKTSDITINTAKLTWNKNTSASKYQVAYSLAFDFASGVKSFETEDNYYNFSGLQFGTKYYFRVRAYDDDSEDELQEILGEWSDWSNTVSATTLIPDYSITFHDSANKTGKYTAKYGTSISADDLLTDKIFKETGFTNPEGREFFKWQTKKADNTYVDVTYPYILKGDVDFYAAYRLVKVQGLKVSNTTSTSITISWTKNAFASYYVVEQAADKDFKESAKKSSPISDKLTFTVNDLGFATTKYFRVKAYEENGSELTCSEWSSVVSGTTLIPDFTITFHDSDNNTGTLTKKYGTSVSVSDTQVNKIFEANNFVSPVGKSFVAWQIKNADNSYSDVIFPYLLEGNVDFYARYKINAPSSVFVTEITATSITVAWTPVELENAGTAYMLEYSTDGNFNVCDGRQLGYESYNIQSYLTDDYLLPETTYYIRVRAAQQPDSGNLYEWSDYSEILVVETKSVSYQSVQCEASYENYIFFESPVNVNSGYTKVKVLWKWESNLGIKTGVQLLSPTYRHASDAYVSNEKNTWQITESDCLAGAQYLEWSNGEGIPCDCEDETDKFQCFIQNSTDNPVAGTVYVSKIWLTGYGLDDLVLFEAK